jgi:hypothetical protein
MVDWTLLTNADERLAVSDYEAGVTALVDFMYPDDDEDEYPELMTIEQLWTAFEILADENNDLSAKLDAANERIADLEAIIVAFRVKP